MTGPRIRWCGPVPATDGTALHTVVVGPSADSAPMLLLRTPYGTGAHLSEAFGWARRGIGVTLQDVRGRYASEGTFQPYRNEADDGTATADWLLRQDFCDGRLIAYGSSYAAHCAAALAGRVALCGLLLAVPALDSGASFRTDTGVPRLFARASWWTEHGDSRVSRGPVLDRMLTADPTALQVLPVTDLPARIGLSLPSFADDWQDPGPIDPAGDLLRRIDSQEGSVPPPMLVVGGLHDSYRDHCVRLWQRWPHPSARLLLGAWQHDLGLIDRDRHGDLSVAAVHRLRIARPMQDWISAVLAGSPPPGHRMTCAVEQPAAGRSWWRTDTVDLPMRTDELSADRTTFTVDPEDPHPGVFDTVLVDELTERSDLVTWRGPVLGADTELLGRPRLSAAGLAGDPHTGERDWAIRLLVHSAAGDLQLTGTLVRTAASAFDLELPYLAVRLAAGSRLVVQLSAHQFPLYPRDPLTGENPLTATSLRSGRRSVAGPVTLRVPLGAAATELSDDPFDPRWCPC